MREYQKHGVGLYLAAVALLVAWSIRTAGGDLFFALDDPYIHFAVAENILRGGYGVNPGEYASPSSSILWPFLMCLPVMGGIPTWGTLLIGVAAGAATTWLLSGALWDGLALEEAPDGDRRWALLLVPWLIVSVNGFALPMTGMEHSLHVLASVMVVSGLADLARRARITPSLWIGILLGPLLRFEGLALAAAALVAIACARRWAVALGLAATLAAMLVAFGSGLASLGLPPLPGSVLVKSGIAAAALDSGGRAALATALAQAAAALDSRWGATFFLAAILTIRSGLHEDASLRASWGVVLPCLAALGAHLVFGRNGWFGRYEVYAVAILLMVLLGPCAREFLAPLRPRARLACVAALLAFLGQDYLLTTLRTPAAARNVMQQQYQMHRFATEYFPHPVAVNDLGWVSFRNEQYVLDLRGLASEASRRIALEAPGAADAVRRLVRSRGVVFAMVYEHWLGKAVPEDWCRVAILRTSQVTSGSDHVSFYLIDPQRLQEMTAALSAFAPTLPQGAWLEVLQCPEVPVGIAPGGARTGPGSSPR